MFVSFFFSFLGSVWILWVSFNYIVWVSAINMWRIGRSFLLFLRLSTSEYISEYTAIVAFTKFLLRCTVTFFSMHCKNVFNDLTGKYLVKKVVRLNSAMWWSSLFFSSWALKYLVNFCWYEIVWVLVQFLFLHQKFEY